MPSHALWPGLVSGCALLAIGAAHAAENAAVAPDSWLEPVLVTGSRIVSSAPERPVATSVFDAESIIVRDPVSLTDLLRTGPGLQITQPGGGAGIVSLYTRGCQPNYTLFLVDGVKVTDSNDSRGGSFDLSTVSPDEIERVEVIRGPQSAVYGADALCGVVNVITRSRAPSWGTTVGGWAGSHGLYDSVIEFAGPVLAKGGLSLSAGTSDQGTSVPGATYGTTHVNGKLTLDAGTGWTLTLHGRHSDDHGTTYPDQSGGPEHAASPDRDVRSTQETSFDVQGRDVVAGTVTLTGLASGYRHQVHFTTPGVGLADPPRGEDSDLKRQYYAFNGAMSLPPDLRASAGVDYLHEDADLEGYLNVGFPLPDGYRLSRHVFGTFGEIEYAGVAGLELLGSVRYDDPSSYTGVTTASMGAVYTPDGGITTLRANWGQGYKLPSLWALGNSVVGNPSLVPERSRTTEVGFARLLLERRLKVDVALFDSRYSNLIDFDDTLFKFVNRPEVTAQGGEAEVSYEVSDTWRVRGEATYVQVDARDSGIPLRGRTKWRGSLESVWRPVPQWMLAVTFLSVAPTFDTTFISPPTLYLGGYSRLDLSGTWEASQRLTLTFAVDNAFNHRIEEAYGFLAAGVTPRAGFLYRF